MIHNSNIILYEQINRIKLNIYLHGHSIVGTEWHGKVAFLPHSRLWYTVRGNSYIIFNKKRIFLPPGKWVLLPSNLSYNFECPDEMEQLYFHFKLSDFDEIDILSNYTEPIIFDYPSADIEYLKSCVYSDNIIDGFKTRQEVYAMLIHLLETYPINIKYVDYSPYVFDAIKYIKENLSMQLTISEISQHIHISKSTLTKRFRKELECSVNDYIFRTIMFEAERHLLSTTMPCLAISEKYNFTDQFYFSRRFKECFGISPQQYRKKHTHIYGGTNL